MNALTINDVKRELHNITKTVKNTLPSNIQSTKFFSIAIMACRKNPDFLAENVLHQTLYDACEDAAADGLLLNGKEAALVKYWDRNSKKFRIQYQPMFQGLIKLARNSGEISTISAHAVVEGDGWEYWIDEDGEHYRHTPKYQTLQPISFYARATMKDGSKQFAFMTKDEVEIIRKRSKAGNDDQGNAKGIWKSDYTEMGKKTVLRRLCKMLPCSTELERALERDNRTFEEVDISPVPSEKSTLSKAEEVARMALGDDVEDALEIEADK